MFCFAVAPTLPAGSRCVRVCVCRQLVLIFAPKYSAAPSQPSRWDGSSLHLEQFGGTLQQHTRLVFVCISRVSYGIMRAGLTVNFNFHINEST